MVGLTYQCTINIAINFVVGDYTTDLSFCNTIKPISNLLLVFVNRFSFIMPPNLISLLLKALPFFFP